MISNTRNILLNELAKTENMSIRSKNICEWNGLLDLRSIVKFYIENNGFKTLRNCENSSNVELVTLCKRYEKSVIMENEFISAEEIIDIEKLFRQGEISIRSKHVCGKANVIDIKDLINYYKTYGTFTKIKNCGVNSNEELVGICNRYKDYCEIKEAQVNEQTLIEIDEHFVYEHPVKKKFDRLTTRQKEIIDNNLFNAFRKLSVRSSNALDHYLGSNINLIAFLPILTDDNFNKKDLKNVGEKSETEIIDFITFIKKLIDLVSLFENEDELLLEKFYTSLERNFNVPSDIRNKIGSDYDFSRGIPIFKTLNVLLENTVIFEKKLTDIFFKGLNYSNKQVLSLEEISKLNGLTRERTRQLRLQIIEDLPRSLAFIKQFEFETINFYGLDINSELILINDDIVYEINEKEQNSFNNLFILKIISILLNNTHKLIGNEENLICSRITRTSHNWNSTYLIKNELANTFDFEGLVDNIDRRLNDRIEEDYTFHFETYLMNFKKGNFSNYSKSILRIAEHIIFNEFEISIDINDNIIFKRNTVRQVYEYSYEALEELGQPSKLEVIYNKIKELYPEYNTDESSIRASLHRKNGFISFGRTSVYGLKNWEEEKDIRGGTIRNITEEFLLKVSEPKHIDEITEYVNRYRNTTCKNIYANLKMEDSNRFEFFKGLKIGLKSKNYENSNCIKVEESYYEKRTWEENFLLLENFLNENNKLPSSKGIVNEEKMYRFLRLQINLIRKGKLKEPEKNKFEELIKPYSVKLRTYSARNTLKNTYEELDQFISSHQRLPNSRIDEERSLYNFYYRKTKLFQNGDLPPEQVRKYIELKNLIQKIYENRPD